MIEEGTYRAKSLKAALGESSTGKEQVGVEWELLDYPGQRITSYHYFSSDEAIRISLEQLRAAGFQGTDITDLSSLFPDANPPEVELVIEHDTYNGKTKPKVKFINSLGGVQRMAPLDRARQQSFAARMKGAIAAFDQQRGTVHPISTRPAAPRQAAEAPKPHQQRVREAAERHGTSYLEPPPEQPFVATDDDVPF